ncbi:MAG: class I SAM-dependent methyltransferase [Bdellovibrionia bacterium]
MTVIWPESEADSLRARELSSRLQLPAVKSPPAGSFCLKAGAERIELLQIGADGKITPGISADFLTGPMRQLVKSAGKGQPLAKALALTAGPFHVVDATAGLGKDALFLAALGCRVTAVEKNPVIHALLEDGLARAKADAELGKIAGRIELVFANASEYLSALSEEKRPDGIYLDPMFPLPKKSALPKKEMQIFRAFLEADEDSRGLLQTALRVSKGRVVVKRPSWAEPLLEPVQHRFDGKLVSFDSYLSSAGQPRYI